MRHLAVILAQPIYFVVAVSVLGCSSDTDRLDQPVLPDNAACASNDDCKDTKPFCDIAAEICVECLFDTQCTGGAQCRSRSCVVPTTCETSLDCVALTDATICDSITSTCVQCVQGADCASTADCVSNQCVAYEGCETSLDCSSGTVCDMARGRCVECVGVEDCPDGNICIGNMCEARIECMSDNQCTSVGKLCDKARGYCVACLTNVHCPDFHHCDSGACVLNACEVGSTKCQGNAVAACTATGESWGVPQPCLSGTTCAESDGVAACVAGVCDPGKTYCQGDELISCAADGMSIASTVDCAASAKHCFEGMCSELACVPNALYCSGKEVRQCDPTGTGSTVVQTCGAEQSCDPSTISCVTQFCSPGAPVCNGDVATTCNSQGTGYSSGGTDCSVQNESCSEGVCVDCPVGGAAPTSVRMTELFMGSVDYIILSNRGSCAAELDSLSLHVSSNKPSSMDFDFPPFLLGPGENVYVIYSSSSPSDIVAPDLVNFLLPSLGEWVALCQGACSGGPILDYFEHADGGQPPAGPSGVTFPPGPLAGLNFLNENVDAYKRIGFAGSYPAFNASDWQVGPASRPQ